MKRNSGLFSLLAAYFTLGIATSTINVNGAMVDAPTLIAFLNNPTFQSITAPQIIGNTGPGSNEILFNTSSAIMPVTFRPVVANAPASGVIFTATRPVVLKDVAAVYSNASSSGNVMVEKLASNIAPGSGITMLTAAMNLATSTNIPVRGSMNATTSSLTLAANESIGLVFAGTTTNLVGLCITGTLAPV